MKDDYLQLTCSIYWNFNKYLRWNNLKILSIDGKNLS